MNRPNFFVVGAPKAGTTAIASYLSEHPNVFMCDPKEPHHFNTDHNFGEYKDRDEYLALFAGATDAHRIIGEASVWYLFSKSAPVEIERELPGSKYLIMLRNPVEMVVALHEQKVFSGFENLTDFVEAWNAQEDRAAGRRIPPFCTEPKHLVYRDSCGIGTQLDHWKSIVPEDRLQVVFFDDFRRDPVKVWLELQVFLGIADDQRREFPMVNSAKERKSPALKFAYDIYTTAKKRLGIPRLGTGLLIGLDKWNKRERTRAALQDHVRQMLVEAFLPEIERVEAIQGVDLSAWKK